MSKNTLLEDSFLLTLDVDWAPDFVIDWVADYLIERQIKATWFLTHDCPAIRKILSRRNLFECGLHPNFLPGSSHGRNEKQVLQHMRKLFPDLKLMRTHALYQSSPMLIMAATNFGVETDLSLLLPGTPHLRPHEIYCGIQRKRLLRIPYFWEDDVEMSCTHPVWRLSHPKYHVKGLKIFDFHPMHVYLNSKNTHAYERFKKTSVLSTINKHQRITTINKKTDGARTIFYALADYIIKNQKRSLTVSQLIKEWRR